MTSSSENIHWPILKNVLSLISGRVFISLSRLIISLIIVRLASPDLFGEYVVVMSILFIGEWLVDFGFTDIAVRNISQEPENKIKILNAFAVLKVIQAFIAYGLVVLAIILLGFPQYLEAILVGGFAIVLFGAAQLYRVIFRINMTMYKDMMSESSGVFTMIILAMIMLLNDATVVDLVACHTFSRLVYLAGNMYFGARDFSIKSVSINGREIYELLKQAAPLGIAGILVTSYDSVFPLVISKLMTMEAVAHYTVAIRLVFPIIIVTQAITNVFYTPLSNYWNTNKRLFTATQQNLVEITVFISVGFFCLLHSGAEVIVSIFGEDMAEAAPVLRLLSWAILARALTTTMALPIIICGGQKKTMWLTFIVVSFSVVLVTYLVPIYGIFGAVYAYLFVEIVLNAIPVVIVSQYMAKYQLSWFPVVKMFFAGFVAIGLISLWGFQGSISGSILSVILYIAISYLIGVITAKKISILLKIFKDRSITETTKVSINTNTSAIKAAIVCPGVGLVQRGFERMTDDLFHLLKNDLDLTLFKGGGKETEKEKKLIFINRNSRILRYLPIHKLFGRTPLHVECFTFAISLLIAIRGKGYDIIHCTDPPLARILYKFRKYFNLKFRLLYSEATAMPPSDYPPADHMLQISQVTYEEALAFGIPDKYMTVIPLGLYAEKFTVSTSRSELRKKYGIADDTFVILSIAAINKYHKRINYLIDEFKSIDDNALLWIDGSLDHGDPELIDYAKEVLGERCKITHLDTECVGELFAIADLMVHTAMFEAFGLALIEGASTGLPLLTHNAAHFRWLINNQQGEVDMGITGHLSNRIRELMSNRQELASLSNSEQILNKYRWEILKKDYLAAYTKTTELAEDHIGIADQYGLK